MIVQVSEVLRKTVDGSDWRFDGLSSGHLQSQVRSECQVRVYIWFVTSVTPPHWTLKMNAAEAVETSVTTINSVSQDFTNLDDQPSQTLTDDSWVQTIYFKSNNLTIFLSSFSPTLNATFATLRTNSAAPNCSKSRIT